MSFFSIKTIYLCFLFLILLPFDLYASGPPDGLEKTSCNVFDKKNEFIPSDGKGIPGLSKGIGEVVGQIIVSFRYQCHFFSSHALHLVVYKSSLNYLGNRNYSSNIEGLMLQATDDVKVTTHGAEQNVISLWSKYEDNVGPNEVYTEGSLRKTVFNVIKTGYLPPQLYGKKALDLLNKTQLRVSVYTSSDWSGPINNEDIEYPLKTKVYIYDPGCKIVMPSSNVDFGMIYNGQTKEKSIQVYLKDCEADYVYNNAAHWKLTPQLLNGQVLSGDKSKVWNIKPEVSLEFYDGTTPITFTEYFDIPDDKSFLFTIKVSSLKSMSTGDFNFLITLVMEHP